MTNTCKPLVGNIKTGAIGVSLCKGFYVNNKGEVDLISNMVKDFLHIDCAVLMGANIANEVASEQFCEATIGCRNREYGLLLKEALITPYFRITVVPDVEVVEACGALKVSYMSFKTVSSTFINFYMNYYRISSQQVLAFVMDLVLEIILKPQSFDWVLWK